MSKEINIEELNIILTTIDNVLDIKSVNDIVLKQYCSETEKSLTDENLLSIYIKQKSVKENISIFTKAMEKEKLSEDTIKNILNNVIIQLIPPGTKGVIKGNMFNKIVKEKILSFNKLSKDEYIINFEKKHESYLTDEIPDFYIYNIKNKKIVIGMNQLDLWSGGAQINRGSKYILEEEKHKNSNIKFLSVVCNFKKFTSESNKAFKICRVGFEKERLCYIKNLENIVYDFFEIE
jgi:hypothetical protein